MNESSWKIQDTYGNVNQGNAFNEVLYNAAGKLNSALKFDDVDDAITFSDSNDWILGSDFTIGFWLNSPLPASGSDYYLVGQGFSLGTDWAYGLRYDSGIGYRIRSYPGNVFSSAFTVTPAVNTWQYYALSANGGNTKVYLDGYEVANLSNTIGDSSKNLSIGNDFGTFFGKLNGSFD